MSLVPFAPVTASGLQALGQPCKIFADVSNVWSEIKRSGAPLRVFLERVQTKDFCRLGARIAFGSKTPDFADKDCAWETAFRNEGWQLRSELRPDDGRESMVDDSIAAHIYRAIIDHRGESIVVLSGDGNQRNHSQVSIFDAILSAMKFNIRVVVWCWKQSRNEQYKRLQSSFPSLFSLNYLDECLPPKPQHRPSRTPTPSPPASSRLVYCPFFAKGNCRYGDACKHLHVVPPHAPPAALELSVPPAPASKLHIRRQCAILPATIFGCHGTSEKVW
jgi:CCCH-type zinc finger